MQAMRLTMDLNILSGSGLRGGMRLFGAKQPYSLYGQSPELAGDLFHAFREILMLREAGQPVKLTHLLTFIDETRPEEALRKLGAAWQWCARVVPIVRNDLENMAALADVLESIGRQLGEQLLERGITAERARAVLEGERVPSNDELRRVYKDMLKGEVRRAKRLNKRAKGHDIMPSDGSGV